MASHHRHDISDQAWILLAPYLPGKKGFVGCPQPQTTACSLTLSSGSFAQELHGETPPPDYGHWKNTHRRFCRWRDKGLWKALLEKLDILFEITLN